MQSLTGLYRPTTLVTGGYSGHARDWWFPTILFRVELAPTNNIHDRPTTSI